MLLFTLIHYFTFCLCFMFYVLLVFCVNPSFSFQLDQDLKILSRLLPGYYSNQHQYALDVSNKLPSNKRHLSLQTVIRPVHVPFLENSFNVYIEQYVSSRRNKPFKQYLYSFSVDHRGRAIRMKNLLFRDADKLRKIHKNLEYIQELTEKDVFSRRNCDMLWRKLKKKYFHGATGRDCIAYINGEQLRIEMSATLDSRSLQWQEGWFKVKDGTTSLATEGPYNLRKVQKIKNTLFRPNKQISPPHSNNVVGRYARNHGNNVAASDGVSTKPSKLIWNLETFDAVTERLTSGRSVYMVADATSCSKSGYPDPARFYFGMQIENFEISIDKRTFHGDVLKFSSMKQIIHENEIMSLLREIKLYRDGSVIIDYYVIDRFSNHVTQQAMAICRMYSSETKNGQIKFTSDPFKLVKSIKSFGSLRSSLRKGRDVRMVADLTKCSQLRDKTSIIGGSLKDYDFLDSGDSIAVTFSSIYSNANAESIVTATHAFAEFSKNNRMTLTMKSNNIAKNYSDFFLSKTIKYRCILDKDHSKYGLSLFYS